jgi:hypothetical protein
LENGNYSGYRPLGLSEVFPGLRDNVEMYNVFKFIPELARSHPEVIEQHSDEIEAFQRHIAQDTVQKLLTLIALVLELPEDALTNGHKYNDGEREVPEAVHEGPHGFWLADSAVPTADCCFTGSST